MQAVHAVLPEVYDAESVRAVERRWRRRLDSIAIRVNAAVGTAQRIRAESLVIRQRCEETRRGHHPGEPFASDELMYLTAGDYVLHRGKTAFALDTRHESGALILQAVGELDLNAPQTVLDAAVAPLVTGASVVLDLSGLSFIDASGLSAVAVCRTIARSSGARLNVRGAKGQAAYLLSVFGLADRAGAAGTTTDLRR
jgi:anti-sigma B factor antagonist